MTRREAREQAFQILFEQAVTGAKIDDILHDASEARDFIPNSFAEEVAFGVEENSQQIDSVISQHIRGWSLHRLSKVALALLRLAVYEMLLTIPYQPVSPSMKRWNLRRCTEEKKTPLISTECLPRSTRY